MPTSGKNDAGKKSVSKSSKSRPNASAKDSRRPVEKGIAPSSTRDPSKPQVNKELQQRNKIVVFQTELEQKHEENQREVNETLGQILLIRKENERMQRRQIHEYGITLDALDELTANIEAVKMQNDTLYENMEQAKTLHEKLEIELKETKQRYENTMGKMEHFNKDQTVWENTRKQYRKAEERCEELRKNNKKLKYILLKHHIDPRTDVREFSREPDKDSVVTIHSHRSEPSPKRKLTVKSRYITVGDVDVLREINREERRRGYGVVDRTFDQVSPAYLGFYVKQREIKKEPVEYFRPGQTFPRILAKQ
ncbi:hypothetical protein DPMN_025652 [Dreissena polymorpha]|uniref:Uncharacterized protein n=1 Tax=Dreissena polymorpha TaxID=45954 RepID=A0A9D4RC13_DREPO|nr:hypothetical protein DPMN_025652 [Dreissena polymorpha]